MLVCWTSDRKLSLDHRQPEIRSIIGDPQKLANQCLLLSAQVPGTFPSGRLKGCIEVPVTSTKQPVSLVSARREGCPRDKMPSTAIETAPKSSRQRWPAGASSMHIHLPADWRADDQPRSEEEWCPVCEWDGSWQNLLHRPQDPEDHQGNNEVPWVWWRDKSYSRSSLDASARRGNLCCAVLLAFSKARWGNNTLVTLSKSSSTTTSPLSIRRALLGGGLLGRSDRPVRRLFALKEAGADEPLAPGMQSLSEDLYHSVEKASGMCSRDSSMAWAKKRIDECDAHHPECRSSYVGFLPTRLIFVPADHETHGISLRLGDSIPPDTRYTALSHCWGPETSWPECQTTADNYEQQLLGIPWVTVPRTFADAITITQQLGIEYIWIDSLCIIQRDEADWKLQSVTMHQVYSNAHVTLAAVDSPDSRAGFWLGPSLYWKMPEPLLTFTWRGREYPLLLFSEPVNPTLGIVHGACFEPWDRPPLLTRAWAFQERMVSPRTLFFGRGSLVWDCFTKGEAQPDLFSELLGVASSPCRGPKQHFAAHSAAAAPASSFSVWHQIVSQYSASRSPRTSSRGSRLSRRGSVLRGLETSISAGCGGHLWLTTYCGNGNTSRSTIIITQHRKMDNQQSVGMTASLGRAKAYGYILDPPGLGSRLPPL